MPSSRRFAPALAVVVTMLGAACVPPPPPPPPPVHGAPAVVRGDSLQSKVILERVARVFSVESSLYVAQRPPSEGEPFHVVQVANDGGLTPLPVEGMPVSTRAGVPGTGGSEMRAPSALYGTRDGALWLATTNSASSFGGPARVYRLQQDKLSAASDSWECVSGCHDQDSEAAWAARFGTMPFKGSPKFLRIGLEGSGRLLAICNKEQPACDYYLLPQPLPKTAKEALDKAKPLGSWSTSTELADGSVLLGLPGGSLGTSRMLLVTAKGSTVSYALPRPGLHGVQAHTAERILVRFVDHVMVLEGGTLHDVSLPTDAAPDATFLAESGTLWTLDSSGTFWSSAASAERTWKAAGYVAAARAGSRIVGTAPGALWVLSPEAADDGGAPDDRLLRIAVPG